MVRTVQKAGASSKLSDSRVIGRQGYKMPKNTYSKTQRRVGNPDSLRIISGASRQEPADVADQWEIEIGFYPPRNNDSVFPLLKKIESKGARFALRNPHPPDAITVAILVGSGASLIKSLCGLINTWLQGRTERKVSITGHGFKIKTAALSPTDAAKMIELAMPIADRKLLRKPKSRKATASKATKKKSGRVRR